MLLDPHGSKEEVEMTATGLILYGPFSGIFTLFGGQKSFVMKALNVAFQMWDTS